jgi:aminoglycoside 2'-N-acetyltransferase I
VTVRYRATTAGDLDAATLAQLLDLFTAAWPDGDFSPEDADHAMGGRHFLAEADGRVVGHASVVERRLEVDGRPVRAGYVEAVATLPAWRRQGIASTLMGDAAAHILEAFELGALSTGTPSFYARLRWRPWQGALAVRMPDGTETPGDPEEEGIMVILTASTQSLTRRETLGCEWRPGDAW